MASRKNWLNSSGTCRLVDDECFSYAQQITATYKGHRLFDTGFWSRSTSKHQSIIRDYIGHHTIDLDYANFNNGIEYSIRTEIDNLTYNLNECRNKRKTQKNLDEIGKIERKIARLKGLLEE